MSGTVHHYYARYLVHPSGVTDSLDHWVDALIAAGLDSEIVCAPQRRRDGGNEFARPDRVRTVRHLGWSRGTWIPIGLAGRLRRGDVLVLHEGWVLSNLIAAMSARLRKVPYVVVPHGVYEKGIVAQTRDVGGIRTRVERWILRHAALVHLFYAGERGVICSFAPLVSRFLVIPNGAPVSDDKWVGDGDYFLWIGRFDPHHKGLDNLVRAWARLTSPRPRLVLAGPDFRGGRDQIAELVRQENVSEDVEIRGRVTGAEKASLMRSARAYIHPSRWESCSIMLLEMLATGVPALISGSIHAAYELAPRVVKAVDFTGSAVEFEAAVNDVDRNVALGGAAREWARSSGAWTAMARPYAAGIEMVRDQGVSK